MSNKLKKQPGNKDYQKHKWVSLKLKKEIKCGMYAQEHICAKFLHTVNDMSKTWDRG